MYKCTGGGIDYNPGPYDVTFTAGVTRVAFNIQIANDAVHEGNESFALTVRSTSLPSGVNRGSPGMATVTIVDTTGELLVDN